MMADASAGGAGEDAAGSKVQRGQSFISMGERRPGEASEGVVALDARLMVTQSNPYTARGSLILLAALVQPDAHLRPTH